MVSRCNPSLMPRYTDETCHFRETVLLGLDINTHNGLVQL